MCADGQTYTMTSHQFPITIAAFREFLVNNGGPYVPSDSKACPLAKAMASKGLLCSAVGVGHAYWRETGDPESCYSRQASLPEWAHKFREEYDWRGKYGPASTGFEKLEGADPLKLFDELFPHVKAG